MKRTIPLLCALLALYAAMFLNMRHAHQRSIRYQDGWIAALKSETETLAAHNETLRQLRAMTDAAEGLRQLYVDCISQRTNAAEPMSVWRKVEVGP
jgi:hypothetical protein